MNLLNSFQLNNKIAAIALPLLLLALIGTTASIWFNSLGWWDQQRLYQVILLGVAALFAFKFSVLRLPKSVFSLLLVFLGLGLVSALLAHYPWYALKEWALYLGLFLFTLLMAKHIGTTQVQTSLLLGVAIAAGINAYQFLVYYLMAFVTGIYMLNADLLFNGFSNPRFLNQFQGLLIPVLSYLVLHFWRSNSRYRVVIYSVLFAVLATQWCIAFTLGGRSLWVGLTLSHLALLLFFRYFWRLLLVQALAMLAGAALFYLLFFLIPEWLALDSTVRTSLRVTSSGRVELWSKAFALYLQSPWLGVGPMHLAEHLHLRFTSPHQGILQLLAEWGPIPALIAVYLAAKGMIKGALYLRQPAAEHMDAALWLSIGTALVMAQFEGVFNAPYTQMWLAILIAITLARWMPQHEQSPDGNLPKLQAYTWHVLAVPVFVISALVLMYEVPTLAEDSQAHMEKHGTGNVPRYWSQGWIPMDGK